VALCWHERAFVLTLAATSTGTTIVGVKFGGGDSGEEEGVCLGADTRATAGPIVADKNCEKVCLCDFCCG
jgi:20S proteasome alpha/beta subunit